MRLRSQKLKYVSAPSPAQSDPHGVGVLALTISGGAGCFEMNAAGKRRVTPSLWEYGSQGRGCSHTFEF